MKRRVVALMALGLSLLGLVAPLSAQAQTAAPEGRLYTPGPFEALEIAGAAEVRLQQGSSDEVFVEGNAAVQRGVELVVRDGVLHIDSPGSWKFWNAKRLQLTVTARRLSRLSISGAATLHAPAPLQATRLVVSISGSGLARLDQLSADQLTFSASGAGDADISGQVRELSISVSGRSEFRGSNLMSRRAGVSIAGLGDVKLWATEDLSISVTGVGQVEYWGSPRTVRRSTGGAATIIDRGPKAAPP